MTSFDYCSDLHFEMNAPVDFATLFRTKSSDCLLVAGDVAIPVIEESIREAQSFFKEAQRYYKTVVFVLGNHDYWGLDIKDGEDFWRLALPKTIVLGAKEPCVDINGVSIVGGTLWTHIPKDSFDLAYASMPDYQYILDGGMPLTVRKLNEEFRKTKERIFSLAKIKKQVVVLTHTAPSFLSEDKRFKGSETGICFASNLEKEIQETPSIRAWIHGHIHSPSNYQLSSTKVLANPLGIPGENPGIFQLRKICI